MIGVIRSGVITIGAILIGAILIGDTAGDTTSGVATSAASFAGSTGGGVTLAAVTRSRAPVKIALGRGMPRGRVTTIRSPGAARVLGVGAEVVAGAVEVAGCD